jgi:hypothetical protein
MTKTMKAIVQDQYGPPDVLAYLKPPSPDVDRGCFAAKRERHH